jgi:hypothetical protein
MWFLVDRQLAARGKYFNQQTADKIILLILIINWLSRVYSSNKSKHEMLEEKISHKAQSQKIWEKEQFQIKVKCFQSE